MFSFCWYFCRCQGIFFELLINIWYYLRNKLLNIDNMDQKTKINAAISYFFLWELFLLAKSNPHFSHPFIRNHAKNATKIHFIFLCVALLYNFFLASFLYITLPIIAVSIHFIVLTSIVWLFIFLLIKWAYKAYIWVESKELRIRKDLLKVSEKSINGELSETQIMLFIWSNVPFLGMFIANKYPTWVNCYWEKISWFFAVVFVLMILTSHSDLFQFFVLFYIGYLVFMWIMAFMHSKIFYSSMIASLPDLNEIYIYIKSFFYYIFESFKVIFWKKQDVSFEGIIQKQVEKEEKFNKLAGEFLSNNTLVFSNKLIYIPVINLIYLPKYFIDKKSRYVFAIIQGLIITGIMAALFFFDRSLFAQYQIVFLFPILLWMANIDANPFYKIPLVYEIYSLLDKLSFWIFSNMRFLKEKKNEINEVSFKV